MYVWYNVQILWLISIPNHFNFVCLINFLICLFNHFLPWIFGDCKLGMYFHYMFDIIQQNSILDYWICILLTILYFIEVINGGICRAKICCQVTSDICGRTSLTLVRINPYLNCSLLKILCSCKYHKFMICWQALDYKEA